MFLSGAIHHEAEQPKASHENGKAGKKSEQCRKLFFCFIEFIEIIIKEPVFEGPLGIESFL